MYFKIKNKQTKTAESPGMTLWDKEPPKTLSIPFLSAIHCQACSLPLREVSFLHFQVQCWTHHVTGTWGGLWAWGTDLRTLYGKWRKYKNIGGNTAKAGFTSNTVLPLKGSHGLRNWLLPTKCQGRGKITFLLAPECWRPCLVLTWSLGAWSLPQGNLVWGKSKAHS